MFGVTVHMGFWELTAQQIDLLTVWDPTSTLSTLSLKQMVDP